MTNQQDRANKVVEAFRRLLDQDVSQQISESQFETLALMINEVISEELGVAADMMEDVIKRLRVEYSKSELGM